MLEELSVDAAPGRLFLLDALRGLAALTVVLFHWSSYQATPVGIGGGDGPWRGVLYLVYDHGHVAVDLFFALSGFVFFHLYARRIASGSTDLRSFAILRLSRLYPLHFATLLAVLLIQCGWFHLSGAHAIYENNDVRHFVLNLLFLNGTGLQTGYSFNGPAWSVSVEILLYGVFFAYAWCLHRRLIGMILLIVLGRCVSTWGDAAIGTGLECFFVGGIVSVLYTAHGASITSQAGRMVSLLAAGLSWAACAVCFHPAMMPHLSSWHYDALNLWFVYAVFPASIVCALAWEGTAKRCARRLAWLGDISYGIYLWHFPLQAALALGLAIAGTSLPAECRLLGYVALLLVLASLSYRFFERPVQTYLRRRLL